MNIELINEQLSELQRLIQGWRDCDSVSEIEREIALDKLKRLYEDIKFGVLTSEKDNLHIVNLTASPLMEEGVIEENAIEEDAIYDDATDDDATDEEVTDEEVTDEGVTDDDVIEECVINECATEECTIEECVTENQSIDEIVEESVEEHSFTQESVAEESITEENIAEEYIAEEPTPEELVVVETPSDAEPKEESFISIALEDISIVADLENPDETYEESTRDEAIHEEPIHKEPIHEEPIEPQPEIVAEIHVTPTPKRDVDNALFDLATIPIRTKARRSAIMSLYSDGVKHTPQVPPQTYAQKSVEEPLLQLSDEREESKDEELAPIEELTLIETSTIETSTINTPNMETPNMEISNIESSNIELSNMDSSNIDSSNIDSSNIDSSTMDSSTMESIIIETITIDDTPTIGSPKVSTFADAYVDNIETIGELYATNNSCAIGDVNIASSLSSINDRYLISQELFGGDMSSCEDMLAELTDIDNFDDAMIYIVENYEWNPDSEATMLIIKHLEQKFQIN